MNPEESNSDSLLDAFHDPKAVLKSNYESVQEAVADHQKLAQLNIEHNNMPKEASLPMKPAEPETRQITPQEREQLNLKQTT